jgi:hypothetical protein
MSATATLRPLRQIYDWVCVNGEDCQIIEDPNHSTNIKVRFQDGRPLVSTYESKFRRK